MLNKGQTGLFWLDSAHADFKLGQFQKKDQSEKVRVLEYKKESLCTLPTPSC